MSAYPIMLDGTALSAVVAGGGRVATRKVLGLLDAGATVHVVAPEVTPQLRDASERNASLRITRARFSDEHFGDALFIVAATNDQAVNAQIATEGRARGRLVNVVDAPERGNCMTPAVHRAGHVVVAVSADRVPNAAARIRDRIGRMVDDRYSAAVRALFSLRSSLLERGERARWDAARNHLLGDDFCERVEAGEFDARVAEWR